MDVREEVDLEFLRGRGLQGGEELLPDEMDNFDGLRSTLLEFGFQLPQINAAIAAQSNLNPNDPNAIERLTVEQPAGGGDQETRMKDGVGKYRLVGLISHIGSNTHSGHYVAHLRKGGQFYQFNDEKVAVSVDPPLGHAYLYLYQRL